MSTMLVREVMSPARAFAAETPIQQAQSLLQPGELGVVLAAKHRVVGVLNAWSSPEDRGLAGAPASQRVDEVMLPSPWTISQFAPLSHAASVLVLNGLPALPVIDADHRLVGMLTLSGALAGLLRELRGQRRISSRPARSVDESLRQLCGDEAA